MIDLVLVHVVAVTFVATLIRSTLGFGEALVAVPLLALRIPVQVAAPLAVLASITVASSSRRRSEFRSDSYGGLIAIALILLAQSLF